MIDINSLKHCDFEPWLDIDNTLFIQLGYLSNIDITNPDEMHIVIEAFEILQIKLTGWMISHRSHFSPEDKSYLADMFNRNLLTLKEHEGVDFARSLGSMKM
jgi:hypothetical protein